MPQFWLLVAGGLVAWAGYKLFKSEQTRVFNDLKKAKKNSEFNAGGVPGDPVKLEKDPESGVYRPQEKD